MHELTVTKALTIGSLGSTLAIFIPDWTPAVIVCALAGAIFSSTLETQQPICQKLIQSVVSFLGGVYFARYAAQVVSGMVLSLTGRDIEVPEALGALVASATCVTLLFRALKRVRGNETKNRESGT